MATTTPPSTLGAHIRDARKAKGMTQAQLGEAVGMLQSSVSGWESGKVIPGLTHLFQMADVLGVRYEAWFKAAVADYKNGAR